MKRRTSAGTSLPPLNRSGDMPLYLQIKNHLLAEIQTGKWKEDELLPTDDELCAHFEVSKITVREATKILVKEGFLERIQGKGTFVRRVKYEPHLSRLFSFTKWARLNGLEPSTRVLKIDSEIPGSDIAEELGIKRGKEVTCIARLRLGDNEPLCFEQIFLSTETCPDIHLKDVANRPFNDIIADDYGISLVKSSVSIEPGFADPYAAKLLRMKKGDLALMIHHKVSMVESKVAYVVHCVYRGDKVKFIVEL